MRAELNQLKITLQRYLIKNKFNLLIQRNIIRLSHKVEELAKNIHDVFWYRRRVSEGTKGPIEYEFTKRQIVISKNGLADNYVWLIMRRTLREQPSYRYFISNAPVSTRLPTFVWLSGLRWAIEQCLEEGKTD